MPKPNKLPYVAEIHLSTSNPSLIAEKAYQIFGVKGTHMLSTFNAYCWNRPNFSDAVIHCTGRDPGKLTISELFQLHLLAPGSSRAPFSSFPSFWVVPMHLGNLSEAFPHVPFLYVSNLSKNDKKAFVNRKNKIQTSLPIELQYAYSAALPLGPKTRMAHKHWFETYLQLNENHPFDPEFYQRQLAYERFICKLSSRFGVKDKLKKIETAIELTERESQCVSSWDSIDYYYDAGKDISKGDYSSIAKQVQRMNQEHGSL